MSNVASHVQITSAVTLTTTAETVIVVSGAVQANPQGSVRALIQGHINMATGASVTAITLRVRQGTTTGGTLVAVAETHTIGAAVNGNIPFSWEDASGWIDQVGGGQYCVTAQQTGATGNGFAWGDITVTIL